MWPKAFSQLIELAPHISRLLPMADRFFQTKTAGDDGTRKVVEALALDMHGNLGQVTAAQTTLRRQMEDLSGKVGVVDAALLAQINGMGTEIGRLGATLATLDSKFDTVVTETRGARLAAESIEARLRALESRHSRVIVFFVVAFLLLAVIVVLQAMLFFHGR